MTDTVLAADIGATSMRAALVTDAGEVHHRESIPTLSDLSFEDATERLLALIRRVRDSGGGQPASLGIATAGPVDPATGTYSHVPNLSRWHGYTMLPSLEQRLGLPVRIGHDATLAALAETQFGSHAGVQDLVYVTVSTGIGAGFISGGRMLTGAHGGAGEAGHMIVMPGGPSCGAGCAGCLEAMASGTGIVAETQRRIEAGATTALQGGSPSAASVVAAAREGDVLAIEVVDTAIEHLASGIAGLLAIFDPEVLVLGGGVIDGLSWRWDDLLAATQSKALPRYREELPVVRTNFGGDACLLGAAALALGRDASRTVA